MNLSNEQAKFFIQFIATGDHIEAYEKTFDINGLNHEEVDTKASELITFITQSLADDVSGETLLTAKAIIEELAKIGFSDISDFISTDGENVTIRPTNDVDEKKTCAVASIKQGTKGIEVKLYDKLKALELLGKCFGIFSTDKGNNQYSEESLEDFLKNYGDKYEY